MQTTGTIRPACWPFEVGDIVTRIRCKDYMTGKMMPAVHGLRVRVVDNKCNGQHVTACKPAGSPFGQEEGGGAEIFRLETQKAKGS